MTAPPPNLTRNIEQAQAQGAEFIVIDTPPHADSAATKAMEAADLVLDGFGGSGSTLVAAESCGRQARLLECDAAYCDTIVARWQRYTGKMAQLIGADGTILQDFERIAVDRLGQERASRLEDRWRPVVRTARRKAAELKRQPRP